MKKLIKFAMVIGAIAVAARLIGAKKAEWEELTEGQVREKLDARIQDQVPDDKRAEVDDKVVSKMRARGKLTEDEVALEGDAPVESGSDD